MALDDQKRCEELRQKLERVFENGGIVFMGEMTDMGIEISGTIRKAPEPHIMIFLKAVNDDLLTRLLNATGAKASNLYKTEESSDD